MSTGFGEAAPAPPAARVCSASRGLLSEGPRWDADRAELIWVDILAGEMHTATLGADGRLEPVRTRHVLRIDGLGVTGPPCTPYRGTVTTP